MIIQPEHKLYNDDKTPVKFPICGLSRLSFNGRDLAKLQAGGYPWLVYVAPEGFDAELHKLNGVMMLNADGLTVTEGYRDKTVEELDAEYKASIPSAVSMRQARVYLIRAGLLDSITQQIESMGGEALATWEYSQEVQRINPLVAAMGFTEEQLDTMFLEASKL